MSQQKKLEKVLDLLLAEDTEQASEILHQIIVEKARLIYESIIDEEDEAEVDETLDEAEMEETDEDEKLDEAEEVVGGEPSHDFNDEIGDDLDNIDADHENDGEPTDEFGDESTEEMPVEDRVDNLEAELEELRAEFDALMGEELQEPEHADLGAEMGEIEDEFGPEADEGNIGDEEEAAFFEARKSKKKTVSKKDEKLEKAPQAKDKKKDKKIEEETFLDKVPDTGQKGTPKLVGTGNKSTLGAEQTKSPYTSIPARKDYGGKPVKFGSGTGGEYGKYTGDKACDETQPSNTNVKVEPKKSGIKADTTPKLVGGKSAGTGLTKSPLSKKPS